MHERQIQALRKASGMSTVYVMMDTSDFMLSLATRGGRRIEMERLARIVYGTRRKL